MHTRMRTILLPDQLARGDQLQDHGRARTVERVEQIQGNPFVGWAIYFNDGGDVLSVPPGITITVWRGSL